MRGFDISRHPSDRRPAGALPGTTYARLNQALKRINENYKSLIPGRPPACCRRITLGEVIAKLMYILKAPIKDHRVWPENQTDPDTGEITTVGYSHKKCLLRTGDRVKMCRVMADRRLDLLAFAGGIGAQVLASIRDEALRPYRMGTVAVVVSREA